MQRWPLTVIKSGLPGPAPTINTLPSPVDAMMLARLTPRRRSDIDNSRNRFKLRDSGRLFVRRVKRKPGEDEPAGNISDRNRDLIPYPPIGKSNLGAENHARWNHEHIHDRVLEPLAEEREDRKPHREDLA